LTLDPEVTPLETGQNPESAGTDQAGPNKKPSLSGVLCLRHSMSKRSIYANESKNRHGGQGGIAAHFA
jgi:hypothetical protein